MLKPPTNARDNTPALRRARLLALLVPLALLGGAYAFQYIGGLYPCEMCWWQRYPHAAAILLAALAFTAPPAALRARALTMFAAFAIAVSGAIGVYHAGVEYGWWQGLTHCTGGAATLEELMKAPLIRCDQPQWKLGPLSLAGLNAIFSLGGAALVLGLLVKGARK